MSIFEGIFSKLFENKYINSRNIFSDFKTKNSIKGLLDKVVNCKGEASALAYSEKLMKKIENLNDKNLLDFFTILSKDYDFDNKELLKSVSHYADDNSVQNYKSMTSKFHSKRMEIFKNLNSIERGTIRLVNIRERLLNLIKENIELKKVDIDLSNLFKSWFNRGFLVTHPITWDTSAKILEKIIKYEAVHEISSWLDLRNRLKPEDRKCYSFFHPTMEDEPLIFVEVALTSEVPSKIDNILDINRVKTDPKKFKTAVFYSISNCQKGLKGISFGNFLLKQVVMDLKKEFPSLETFVTLSPVSGFNKWLKENNPTLHEKIIDKNSIVNIEKEIISNSIEYFFEAKHKDGLPLDPVQRFHLSNGASLDKIHSMGNLSQKGIASSAGLMVNYKYEIDNLENNHEKYFSRELISSSKSLLSKFNKIKKS
jgi:malonyl-CoA decarboxylase